MFKQLIIILLLPCLLFAKEEANELVTRFERAEVGSYIVTAQQSNLSLVLLRRKDGQTIQLEEVAAPLLKLKTLKSSVDILDWLAKKAPGHTAWACYEIDLKKGSILEGYSYSRESWLFLDEQEHFLAKLLTQKLIKTPENERRKIGPEPADGLFDARASWSPPKLHTGQKFEAWRGSLPKDNSPLSECALELYFDGSDADFPFPYWVEIASPHYRYTAHALASGKGAISPMPPLPRREL